MSSLRFTPVASSLGFFLAITFTLCVIWGLIFPHTPFQKQFLEAVLPGFTWLSWGGFLLGLVESLLYGLFVALIFVPLYNAFNRRTGESPAKA